MPRAPASKQEKAASKANNSNVIETFEGETADIPDSPHSSSTEEAATSKGGKKRTYTEDEPGDFGNEMQKMLECFGADISKTLTNKRKRLEQFTQSSLKTSNRKVDDIWKNQQGERQKLTDEFSRQITGVFQQWDTDLEKSKEQEEKLLNLFRQQQKFFQQTRITLGQRLKTVKQLQEQYLKAMENLEKCHTDQQTNVQSELKKEMQLLQKKILMDTQEMANVRKSLQTMLF